MKYFPKEIPQYSNLLLFRFRYHFMFCLFIWTWLYGNQCSEGYHHRMNTSQLQCCIQCDPVPNDYIVGVFPADGLPQTSPKYPFGFIAKTDQHSKSGKHWCTFYIESPGVVEFFDSFREIPAYYNANFSSWINRHAHIVKMNMTCHSRTKFRCVWPILFIFFTSTVKWPDHA